MLWAMIMSISRSITRCPRGLRRHDEHDIDEADTEVGSFTTAAQSMDPSCHISQLSASLSLLMVGGYMSNRASKVRGKVT